MSGHRTVASNPRCAAVEESLERRWDGPMTTPGPEALSRGAAHRVGNLLRWPPMKTLKVDNVAQAYLELLEDRGVDFFFANAGTDFASLVDAFARREAEGKRAPRPIVAPHESVAVGMAHGVWLATGRPQAVMVHVTVGTANAACGIITAARSQVPMLMSAGRTPDRKSTRLNSSHLGISYAVFCLKKT